MYFSEVLPSVMNGHAIARKGWNGKGMFVYYAIVKSSEVFQSDSSDAIILNINGLQSIPILALKAADNTITFGWNASQSDMLAADWEVLNNTQLGEIKNFGKVSDVPSTNMKVLREEDIQLVEQITPELPAEAVVAVINKDDTLSNDTPAEPAV